jgi:hypothetical protein
MGKRGRPVSEKQYRKNIVRVSYVEDWVESVISKIPTSVAKTIIVEELENLIHHEKVKREKA